MAAFDQFISSEGEETFKKALNLSTVESRRDPESEPYKSKYKAREILHELKTSSEQHINECDGDERWLFFKSALDYHLGVNYMDTEELSTGQEHLYSVVEALESYKLNPRAANIIQCAYNQLGILWTGR